MDQTATRPPGLYAVGIGMMLFGLLGMCSQGLTIVTTTQQREQIQEAAAQTDFGGFAELQGQFFVPNLVSASLGVVIALALLVFGALTIARVGIALTTPAVLVGAAVVELMQLALSVYFQMKMADIMEQFSTGFSPGGGGGGFGGPESFVSAAMGIGLCVLGGWAVGKCAFFGAGATYLRKPEIRQLFESPPALGPRGD